MWIAVTNWHRHQNKPGIGRSVHAAGTLSNFFVDSVIAALVRRHSGHMPPVHSYPFFAGACREQYYQQVLSMGHFGMWQS